MNNTKPTPAKPNATCKVSDGDGATATGGDVVELSVEVDVAVALGDCVDVGVADVAEKYVEAAAGGSTHASSKHTK